MDPFNFLVAIILIYLALQYSQVWIVFAILILAVLTIKSFKAVVGLIAAALIMYIFVDYDGIQNYFPLVILGILIIGLILGIGKSSSSSETYPGGGYSDLLGGTGGSGGY